MSNAMKKLKLLHHLTAAASHPPPHAAAQALPTPPASPVSPQISQTRHQYNTKPSAHAPHAHYTDVLRSARAALHTLHNSQPQYTNTQHPPPQPVREMPLRASHQQPQQPQCMLPGGFMVLTPASSYDPTPGLCVPASPPPQTMSINAPMMQMPGSVPRGNTTIYSSRPPPAPVATSSPYQRSRQRSPPRPLPKLSRENVAKVGKDSRLARWERVLGYVREQRAATLPAAPAAATNVAHAQYSRAQERARRADEMAAIDARNRVLDLIDEAEMQTRSLWSGGSGGTNGVDEFVWSEDEDDDVMPMPQAPAPLKVLPDGFLAYDAPDAEPGIFECEMQIDGGDDFVTAPTTRSSLHQSSSHGRLGEKRARPRSSPEEIAFQRMWGKRIVEEMPALCRENELDGGLERLVGRRMSAAY